MRWLILILIPFVTVSSAYCGGKKREARILAVKFQVQHTYRCTTCAAKLAEVLRKQDGVRDVRTIAAQDAAVVFFESVKSDLDEMKNILKLKGYVAQIVWGPTAAKLNGQYEEIPLDEIAVKRPTLKQQRENAAATAAGAVTGPSGSNAVQVRKRTVYVPVDEEKLPVPKE
ncbi:MAG: hypothetical protein HY074_10815 [Deltaproteobacteria bacterium]|nr:hypothetical protein [Deltaproteobacteria bacterium]